MKENPKIKNKLAILIFMILIIGISVSCFLLVNKEVEIRDNIIEKDYSNNKNVGETIANEFAHENNLERINENVEVVENNEDYIIEKEKDADEGNNSDNYSVNFYKRNKTNNEIIWTYKTVEGPYTELETIEYLGTTDKYMYINEAGTITVLDIETGKKVWQNSDYNGASSVFCFDRQKNLYMSGYYGPDLCIIDKDGNTVRKIEDFKNEYAVWPDKLYIIDDNKLVIEYGVIIEDKKGILVIDLEDYSFKLETIEVNE